MVGRDCAPVHVHARHHDEAVFAHEVQHLVVRLAAEVAAGLEHPDEVHRARHGLWFCAMHTRDEQERLHAALLAAIVVAVGGGSLAGRPVRLRRRVVEIAVEERIYGVAERRVADHLLAGALRGALAKRDHLQRANFPEVRPRLQTWHFEGFEPRGLYSLRGAASGECRRKRKRTEKTFPRRIHAVISFPQARPTGA